MTCPACLDSPGGCEECREPERIPLWQRDALAPGLHYSLPMQDYLDDPCPEPSLSAGMVRTLVERSALHAWKRHPRLGGEPMQHTRATDVGSAAHSLVLEGASIISVVETAKTAKGDEIVPTTWQTKDAKAQRDKIRASGRIPLLPHEAPLVYDMAKVAGHALETEVGEGHPEVTLVWQEKNGVWCRARADWLTEDAVKPVVDYKTTKKSAAPEDFIRRSLFQMGYDVTAAFYLRGLRALGEPRPQYKFLVQEQDPPFDYSWIALEEECEAIAQVIPWIEEAIGIWGDCLKSGKWPGYSKQTYYPDPPSWRAIQIEESRYANELNREIFGGGDAV